MTTTFEATTKSMFEDALAKTMEAHGIKNRLAAPKISKVCLNMGVGRAVNDNQILGVVSEHLTQLAGQKATITKAKKAVAQFRSRDGMKIGTRVTLRGPRMWAFMDRLVHLAIPRIKDFRGLSPKGFDKAGNFSIGLSEQALFPEVTLDRLDHNQGLSITIVFERSNPELSKELLKGIKMPLRER
jgi:large subunit ribosomal protein L5